MLIKRISRAKNFALYQAEDWMVKDYTPYVTVNYDDASRWLFYRDLTDPINVLFSLLVGLAVTIAPSMSVIGLSAKDVIISALFGYAMYAAFLLIEGQFARYLEVSHLFDYQDPEFWLKSVKSKMICLYDETNPERRKFVGMAAIKEVDGSLDAWITPEYPELRKEKYCELMRVFVLPAYRRMGLGLFLVQEAENLAVHEMGYERCILMTSRDTNTEAVPLYINKFNFTVIREILWCFSKLPAHSKLRLTFMIKNLTPRSK